MAFCPSARDVSSCLSLRKAPQLYRLYGSPLSWSMTSFMWLRSGRPICAAGLPSHIWLSGPKPTSASPVSLTIIVSPPYFASSISLPLSLQYAPATATALCHNSARWLGRSVNQSTTDLRRYWHMPSSAWWFWLQPQGSH